MSGDSASGSPMAQSSSQSPLLVNGRGDQTAICLSGLCMLHCLATPLLIAFLPALSVLEAHESTIHRGLLLMVLPISAWALSRGCARHGRRGVLITGLVALMILGSAPFVGSSLPGGELLLTVFGSLALIASHLVNLRQLQRCRPTAEVHA